MTEKYLLSEVLRVIDSDDSFKALFSDGQLTKYRIIADRLSENESVRPFRVVFCGVFSSGKTSLINALLATDYQLPQGVNPVTKMVTRIRRGNSVSCAYRLNGREVSIPEHYITELIQGKKQLIFGSNELIVSLPSDMLSEKVELMDTPGFNDEAGGDLEQMTRAAIEEADMAVVCCNSLQLGKIVERDLLRELDELLGHYSLVVTRMDNLNTQEDWEAVLEQANRLMRFKGNAASVFPGEPCYVFPVAAAGAMKNIQSFAGYWKAIVNDEEIRARIRAVTDKKSLTMCLFEIRPVFEELARQLRDEVSLLVGENQAALRRQEQDAQIRRNRLLGVMAAAKYTAVQMAESRMRGYAEDIRHIPNASLFQLEANQLANTMADALIHDIAAYSEREHIANYNEVKLMLGRTYAAQGFTVPPPYKTRVRTRGLPRRLLKTTLNFLTFRFHVDDGYEEVYADYYTPAIEAVRGGPMDFICRQWNAYLEQLYSGIRTAGFVGGHERSIDEKQALLHRCEHALQMIKVPLDND